MAALHGVDLYKNAKTHVPETTNDFMFKHPNEYKKMSKKERKELTKKMMGHHKSWASKAMRKKG